MTSTLVRTQTQAIEKALQEQGKKFLQIMIGPRQVGKTWAAKQIQARWKGTVIFSAAEEFAPPEKEWIELQWNEARKAAKKDPETLLILDEVQKVSHWSTVVKALWDQDAQPAHPFRVLLLGSSSLLVHRGAQDSLAGRFMLHRFPHWSWPEMHSAFDFDFEHWLHYGGYPGAAPLSKDPAAWASYLQDSIIEAVLGRDILQMQTVRKPALMRQLLKLACAHPAQFISYNKMLGSLQDAGNTVTLSHYVKLLEGAFLLSGLQPWHGGKLAAREGIPKLILWDNAIPSALQPASLDDSAWRGRLVENAVGARLLRALHQPQDRLYYWRQGNDEVDFVIERNEKILAIEVKSGRPRKAPGLLKFSKRYPRARTMELGGGDLSLEDFFSKEVESLLGI